MVKNLTVSESEFMSLKAENSELNTTLDKSLCSKLNSAPLYKNYISGLILNYAIQHIITY
jgi:hypothetical protein